jgi:hypothetical protein
VIVVKTLGFAVVGMVLLQGCTPPVPASNAGPGFNTEAEFAMARAQRDASLAGSGSTTFGAPSAVQTGAIGASDLAAAGIGQNQPVGAPMSAMGDRAEGGIAASPTNAAPVLANGNVGISDEQSFDAVAGRETIESDAERRAAQAAVREEIQPTALPTRTGNTGPNIVEYALNAPNRKGQEWYSRSIFATKGRFERNCVKFASPDAAQRDFLANGGPTRDRKGIDPDGDGFACGWDPAPFKTVAGN